MIRIFLIFKNHAKLLLLFCVGVLMFSSVFCQTTYIDKRKPALFTQVLSGPVGIYDSPAAAWAAYTDWVVSRDTSPYKDILTNFRPCTPSEGQYGYYWGYPSAWCHDYTELINGVFHRQGTTSVISVFEGCPNGYETVNNAPLSSNGRYIVPYIFERRCEKILNMPHPQSCGVGNPIDPQDQSKLQVTVDYTDPHGLMNFVRTYDSKSGGFTHNLSYDFMPPTKGAIGMVRSQVITMWDQTLGNYITRNIYTSRLNDDGLTTYYVTPTGSRYEFSWGNSSGISLNQYNTDQLQAATFANGSGWLLKRVGEQRFLSFNSAGQLTAITSAQGQKFSLDYSTAAIPSVAPAEGYMISATDIFGRKLMFGYTDGGQLSSLTDPTGQVIYYNHAAMGEGKLNSLARVTKPISVTYQDGGSVQYLWNESAYATGFGNGLNLLTGLMDENNVRFATFRYFNEKAISTEHAVGIEKYTVTDGRSNGAGVVSIVDSLNTKVDWQYGLVGGYSRLKGRNQPAGAGCNASSSAVSYDTNGNLASADDFNGNRTCYSNDLTRNLAVVRVDGLAKTVSCSSVTAAAASLPAGSRKSSTQWHPDWQRETRVVEPLKLTTSVYHGQPDPTAGNAIASCAPTSAVLPDGKPIVVLCKTVEQATTDANGSLGFGATVTGTARTWSYTYNQYGQKLTATDPRGNSTSYVYASATTADMSFGDLLSVTNAAGHVTQYPKYDLAGRVLRRIDPSGVTTDITYTPRGWVHTVSVTPVGGTGVAQVTTYTYDKVGQLTQVQLPDASQLSYSYDAAHRLTGVMDGAGNTVTYTLDNLGNRTGEQLKDPTGILARNITRVYDALSRVQSVTGAPQ